MAKSPSLAHKLFENSLKIVSRGFLNNSAVARTVNRNMNNLRNHIDGTTRWSADNWLLYMLAIGAIYYEDGYLKMALKVPMIYREYIGGIANVDKNEIFSQRVLKE